MQRPASFAGSWYASRRSELSAQLNSWLDQADTCCGAARAIIAPHAGYSYSGPTAAWAYKHVDGTARRVFVLGPSHNWYSPACHVTRCSSYATPLGDITIDTAVRDELIASGQFDPMDSQVEAQEHSIELHLPYIVHVMGSTSFTLVPILVGALSETAEANYGKLLAPYLADPNNLFVISSDFCHWGRRFRFTRHDKSKGAIHQSIEALDRQVPAGMCARARALARVLRGSIRGARCGRAWRLSRIRTRLASPRTSARRRTPSAVAIP